MTNLQYSVLLPPASIFYDADGRLIRTLDPEAGESTQRYDDEGRLFESEDAREVITKMDYDARGRMSKIIDGNANEIETIYGDKSNALEGLVAGRKYPTYQEIYKYDQMDRLVETKQVLSPSLSYVSGMTYDAVGQVETQTDAKGRISLRRYDALRRLIKEVDPILGETSYIYDERDNLLSVTDANGNTHRFTYDRLGRKLTEARPMGQTIRYRYDPNGNLIQRDSLPIPLKSVADSSGCRSLIPVIGNSDPSRYGILMQAGKVIHIFEMGLLNRFGEGRSAVLVAEMPSPSSFRKTF